MKKSSIKNVSLVWGAALLVSASIWIVAQSNANDETAITIDTNRYTATQHIQEVHLNDKSSSTRVWLKNEDSLVLGVGEVGADERVGKLKNSVGGEASVIGGRDNKNWWSESSLIVGGENNLLAHGKLGSVVMGGKSNQVNSSETVVLASKEANTQGSGVVAVAVNGGQVLGDNSLFFAGDHSYVKKNDSMVIGSAVMMDGAWSFAFNAKREGIIVDADHTFIVNADHGLIVGANKNNGTGVSLTVNGAVRVWEAKGSAKDDDKQEGAIFRVACSSPAGASCLCVNVEWQIKSMSSNPACDAVCGGDKSASCTANDLCGTRAITYAAAETGRRANTTFCALGSHKSGPGGSALLVGSTNFPKMWEIVKWHCTSDFGGGTYQCLATRKQYPKENAKCGSYHGMNFMAASLTNWPAGWTFCEKGVPTPTAPAFPKTGKPVTWTCGWTNLIPVTCSANGCNRCSKEGFPYCFPVDFGPSCGSTPTQPVNGQCGTSKDSCASGDFVDVTDTATDYKWQCNGKNGGSSVACSLKKPSQLINGKCGTTKNTCALWDFVDIADTSAEAKWQCNGKNGGSSVACSVCNDGYVLKGGVCVKLKTRCTAKTTYSGSCMPTKVPELTWLRCDAWRNCPVYQQWSAGEWRHILSYAIRKYSLWGAQGETILGLWESHWFPLSPTKESCLRPWGECIAVAKGIFPTEYVEHVIGSNYGDIVNKVMVDHEDRYVEILGMVGENEEDWRFVTPENEQLSKMNRFNGFLCDQKRGYCRDRVWGANCKSELKNYPERQYKIYKQQCEKKEEKTDCEDTHFCTRQ